MRGIAFFVNRTAVIIDRTGVIVHALSAHCADDDPKRFRVFIHYAHSVVQLGTVF